MITFESKLEKLNNGEVKVVSTKSGESLVNSGPNYVRKHGKRLLENFDDVESADVPAVSLGKM